MAEVIIDKSFEDECQRGIYGIFVIKNGKKACAYVGRSEQLKVRAQKHKARIEAENHLESLKDVLHDEDASIVIIVLEHVPYVFDNYYKDAQRLASAECRWIDEFQDKDQCLEQKPEGSRPSLESWEKKKTKKISACFDGIERWQD